MAANGNVNVFVARCFLFHRSRLATAPAPPMPVVTCAGPRRAGHLRSLSTYVTYHVIVCDTSRNWQPGGRPACQVARDGSPGFLGRDLRGRCRPARPVRSPAAAGIRGHPRAGAGASRGLAGTVLPRDPGDSLGDLAEGAVLLESGSHAPGLGTAGGVAGHSAGGGADAGLGWFPVARLRAAPIQARRAAASALSSPLPARAGRSRQGQGLVSPPPGASRPAAGASPV